MSLRELLEKEINCHNFILLDSLHRLINESNVLKCLHYYDIHLQPDNIQEIIARAPKLFALLVLLGGESRISDYLFKGFGDNCFPILSEEDVPDVGNGQRRQDLYRIQWNIPIILDKSRHLNLPVHFIPPFLDECLVNHGSFGYISKVRVADYHLPGYPSVRFLIRKPT